MLSCGTCWRCKRLGLSMLDLLVLSAASSAFIYSQFRILEELRKLAVITSKIHDQVVKKENKCLLSL